MIVLTVTHTEVCTILKHRWNDEENYLEIWLDRDWEDLSDEMKNKLLEQAEEIARQQYEDKLTDNSGFCFTYEAEAS